MEALLSYHPRDLLLFSPRVYWAMVAGNNDAYRLLAWFAPVAGLALLWLLDRGKQRDRRVAFALVGVAWWFVTWSFLWQEYRSINWAVTWAIPLFVAMGAWFLLMAVRPGQHLCRPHRFRLGMMLVLWGTLIHPLGFLVDDRGLAAADTWLLFPEPLAVTTLGLVLAGLQGWRLALAMPIPLLWSLVGGATLLGLGSPVGWAVLACAGVAVAGWLPLSPAVQNQRGTC